MPQELKFGPHTFQLGEEGVAIFTVVGVLQAAQAAEFDVAMRAWQEDRPAAVLIVNLTQATSIDAKARKIIMDGVSKAPYGICLLNASFAMRAVVGLMLNATRLLGRHLPHTFVDNEADAWAWARENTGTRTT